METKVTRLLRVAELQRITGYSRSMCYALIAGGTLPSVKIGRSVRVPEQALQNWIERNTQGAAA